MTKILTQVPPVYWVKIGMPCEHCAGNGEVERASCSECNGSGETVANLDPKAHANYVIDVLLTLWERAFPLPPEPIR